MNIAHFFTVEHVSTCFDTYADVLAWEVATETKCNEVCEWWQTEDGEVFDNAVAAEQHVRDNRVSSFDWDGFNMKGVELMGKFA